MMFVAGAGFCLAGKRRSFQPQERIATINPVPHAKGSSWLPTVVPNGPSVPGSHCILKDLCAHSGLVSFGDPKPITPR